MKPITPIELTVRGAESPAFGRIAAAMMVGTLGLALVCITAFAPMQNIHNAAHDSRHSFAAPCH